MKTKLAALCPKVFCFYLLSLAWCLPAPAQNAVFTYQGRVTDNGTNFTGSGQFKFALVTSSNTLYTTYWSNDGTSVNGSEPATAVTVAVNSGLFIVVLGDTNRPNMQAISAALFTQPNLQLRIWFNDGVNGSSVLNPAQPLTPTPYAISAGNLSGTLPASQLTGTISSNQLSGAYSGPVTFNNGGDSFSGTFLGNGGALSNLNPAALVLSSTNDSIVSWGDNTFGQRTIPGGLGGVTAVAAGYAHTLALLANGTVVAWGAGLSNNPSDGVDYGQSIVPAGLTGVTAISAGGHHSLALKNDGTVVAWGEGDLGQTNVPAGLNNVRAISASYFHSLALKTDGTVVAWGTNNFGQLNIPPGLNSVKMISAGLAHCLALESNGTVVAWGAGLTNNPSDGADFGQSIVPAGLSNVVAISAGGLHSLALKADGTVVAWGAGLTNNYSDNADYGQSIVPPGLSNVVAIVADFYNSLALEANGTVVAWGYYLNGVTGVPAYLDNFLALAPGCTAQTAFALRPLSDAPVAWLDSDNTFKGNIQVGGSLNVVGNLNAAGGLTMGGDLRLDDATLWLRGGGDTRNGLAWIGSPKNFNGFFQPDGPVLFGESGGGLGTVGTNGSLIALSWNNSEQVGIGTTTPSARLDLGGDSLNPKVALGGGMSLGVNGSQMIFNLSQISSGRFSFMDGVGGNAIVTIENDFGDASGRVGIGTASPTTKLDVRGSVKLGSTGQYYAPGGNEDLYIIRGVVASTGSILAGTGFTVTKGATGFFTVNFNPAFSALPAVTVTPQSGINRIATCTSVSTTSTGIWTKDTSGTATDNQFDFIAIGPK